MKSYDLPSDYADIALNRRADFAGALISVTLTHDLSLCTLVHYGSQNVFSSIAK